MPRIIRVRAIKKGKKKINLLRNPHVQDAQKENPAPSTNRILKYWVPLYTYAAVISCISSISRPLPDIAIPHIDKLFHLAEFCLFGLLAARALKHSKRAYLVKHFFVLTIIVSLTYGIIDEIHQYFIVNRVASIFDVLADTIGGTIGAMVYGKYYSF